MMQVENLNILVVWFLLVDEWLHSSALIRDLASMARSGHSVRCIFPVMRRPPRIDQNNLRIYTVRLRSLLPIVSYLTFSLAAIKWLGRESQTADVVVVGANSFAFTLPWLLVQSRAKSRRPIVVVRETSPPVETHTSRRYYLPVFRRLSLSLLSRFCDAVFAISPMHADKMASELGLPRDKIQVWPSSVDVDLFNPDLYFVERDRVRKELGIGDRFLLIYHGVLSHERGLHELIDAIRRVRADRQDALLLLMGKGNAERELTQQATSSKLEGAVLFHSQVDHADVPRFIAASDAGVVPLPDHAQWRYQVPTKLLEYMAMGKPIVVTDMAGNRWVAGNCDNVFSCGRGSSGEIEEAIVKCMSIRGKISENARNEMVGRFSSSVIANSIIRVFTTLLSEREQAGSIT
jgi:glycosyltransferase involved in cell wall biosynthesis